MNRVNRAAEATMLATILFLVIVTDTPTSQNETRNAQGVQLSLEVHPTSPSDLEVAGKHPALAGEVLFTGKLMATFGFQISSPSILRRQRNRASLRRLIQTEIQWIGRTRRECTQAMTPKRS
jgi:hypothetical protein